MGRPRKEPRGMLVAREAMVVVVGARPPTYEKITVFDRRSDKMVEMNSDRILDQGSEGVTYVFKQYQRVHSKHPAVLESPGSFIPMDELDDSEAELVASSPPLA